MPEETVSGMYAKITADMAEFDRDLDRVYDRLDKLEDKDVAIQAETAGVEESIGGLGTELAALGGALTTVFHYLQQTSGGLQAMTSMATGLIGAGVDTFLVEVMIPLWDKLKGAIVGTEEETVNYAESQDMWASKMELSTEGTLEFIAASDEGMIVFNKFRMELEEGRLGVDEFGNTMYKVGDILYYWDGATGQFIGSTRILDTEIGGLNTNMAISADLLKDISGEWEVLAKDVNLYLEGGKEALEALWADDPGQFPGYKYLSDVASAAEEVRLRLATMLLQLGIDPRTGESGFTLNDTTLRAARRKYRGYDWTDEEKVAHYLLSGGS